MSLPDLRSNIISENAKRITSANKNLGQNFILDTNITRKIVGYADITSDTHVIEIGPGPGGLTLPILEKKPQQLILIEKDARCLPGLEDLVLYYKKDASVELIHGDALKVVTSLPVQAKPYTIIANLPYNVASPLLVLFVHMHQHIQQMVLMFQKEVAQRITAKPNNKAYGRLSILAQALYETEIVYHLPPSVFTPPPKVDSAVVRFTPKENIPNIDIHALEQITQTFFTNRRKTVGHIVNKYFKNAPQIQEALSPYLHLRPENLPIDVYMRLRSCFPNF